MDSKSFVEIFKKKTIFFVCFGLVLIVGILGTMDVFNNIDNSIYDLLLRAVPEPPVAEEIVFVDVEDLSLEVVGTWPWPRDVLADTLIRMKELGARSATFDIEYLSPSQGGIDPEEIGRAACRERV